MAPRSPALNPSPPFHPLQAGLPLVNILLQSYCQMFTLQTEDPTSTVGFELYQPAFNSLSLPVMPLMKALVLSINKDALGAWEF